MPRRNGPEPSQQHSMQKPGVPSSASGLDPINGTQSILAQLRRTGTVGDTDVAFRSKTNNINNANSRPSGIERPPFSIGPGENHGVLCAVCYSNSVERTVGLAFVNIPIAEAVLTTITDTQYYPRTVHKIQMMEASRILLQPTTDAAVQSGLALKPHIEDELANVPIVEIPRSEWSDSNGMASIRQVAFLADLPCIEFAAKDNSYPVRAFSVVLKYIRDEFKFTFDDHSVRIKYQPPADVMMISLPTIRSLELIQNTNRSTSSDCLFGLLNLTVTPMGSRLLRSNILQPPTQADVLNPRYTAVGELARTDALLSEVQNVMKTLKPLGDVEQLLTKLVILPKDGSIFESEQAINNILKLKSFLAIIPAVTQSLETAKSPLLVDIRECCQPCIANDIAEILTATIDEHASYATKPLELRNQRVHSVRHQISASLDIQRKLYEDFSGKVHEYINRLEDEFCVKITLKFTAARKFYLQFQACDFGSQGPPQIFINCNKVKGYFECQTLKLISYNERINQAVHGAMVESDGVIRGLLAKIRSHICTLFKYCEGIALVDMLSSFACLTRKYNYTRPVIHNNAYGLVAARHPILDSRGLEKCIPNDYFVTKESRFQMITGQNMSGKSTYIRSIAMLQIMAQIGCYVPAESARFPILYSLFARVSTDDVLEANLSTFSVEMREMAFILRNVNNRSLVIVDELGRATSTRDGLAIATAMSEALLQSKATVFFATHFVQLSHGMANCIRIANHHLRIETSRALPSMMSAPDDIPVVKMLYRVTEGAETDTSYGISLAKSIGFPSTFITRAETVSARLRERALTDKNGKQELKEAMRRKLVVNLDRQLYLAYQSSAADDELWLYLKKIHDHFWYKMLETSDESRITESFDGSDDVDTKEAHESEASGDNAFFLATKSLKRKAQKVGYRAVIDSYEVKRHRNRPRVDFKDEYSVNEANCEDRVRNRAGGKDDDNSGGSDGSIDE